MKKAVAALTISEIDPASVDELTAFQREVSAALSGENRDFRRLLRRCLYAELTATQTSRVLEVCCQFDRRYFFPTLVFHSATQLKQRCQQLGQTLETTQGWQKQAFTLQTARVLVLYAVVYSFGAGLPQDDAVAKQYVELGMALLLSDAFVLAGILARRGYGESEAKPNYDLAQQLFKLAMKQANPEAYLQFADMVMKGEIVDLSCSFETIEGINTLKDHLDKAKMLVEKSGLVLGTELRWDLDHAITALSLQQLVHSSSQGDITLQNSAAQENDSGVSGEKSAAVAPDLRACYQQAFDFSRSFESSQFQTQLTKDIVQQALLERSAEPYELYLLSKVNLTRYKQPLHCSEPTGTESKRAESPSPLVAAVHYLQRAYETACRLRKQDIREFLKRKFLTLLEDPLLVADLDYPFLRYHYAMCMDQPVLEELCLNVGCDTVIAKFILADPVTSSREKMRWILALTKGLIREDLFNEPYSENAHLQALALLALEAADDCLVWVNALPAVDEFALEIRSYWHFAKTITTELQRRFQAAANPLVCQDFSANVRKYKTLLLVQRCSVMSQSGLTGFGRLVRYLIGSPKGGNKLVLPKDPSIALCLVTLLKQSASLALMLEPGMIFNDRNCPYDEATFLTALLAAVPHEQLDKAFERQLQPLGLSLPLLRVYSDEQAGILVALENFCDFCERLPKASSCEMFAAGSHGAVVSRDTKLYMLFNQNVIFVRAVTEAVRLLDSTAYQPRFLRFFPATRGMTQGYQEQLQVAKALQADCEALIFSASLLNEKLVTFLKKTSSKSSLEPFVTLLMGSLARAVDSAVIDSLLSQQLAAWQTQGLPANTVCQLFCAVFEDLCQGGQPLAARQLGF